jgi:hypothetical protein
MYGNGLLEMLPRFQIEQKEERWKEGRKKRRKEEIQRVHFPGRM